MPALALVALIPLVLSLFAGAPGLLRTSEPVAFIAPAVSVRVDDLLPEDASNELALAAAPGPLNLATEPLTDATTQPLPVLKPVTPASRPNQPLTATPAKASQPVVSAPFTPILSLLHPPRLVTRQGGPSPLTAEDIVNSAESLMGVPYMWGGISNSGLDCSAFVSRVWGVSRRTTESLPGVAFRIDKEELLPGDILNLTIGQDPRGYGHVRLFAGWANGEHTRMWVYEETPPRSIHRVIAYDARYTPLRRINYSPGNLAASHLVSMLFGRQEVSVAAPAAVSENDVSLEDAEEDDSPPEDISTAPIPHARSVDSDERQTAPRTAFGALALPDGGHDWLWSPLPLWMFWQPHPASSPAPATSVPVSVSYPAASIQAAATPAPVQTAIATPAPVHTATVDSSWDRSYAAPSNSDVPSADDRQRRPAPATTPAPARRTATSSTVPSPAAQIISSDSSELADRPAWHRPAASPTAAPVTEPPVASPRPAPASEQPAPGGNGHREPLPTHAEPSRHEQAAAEHQAPSTAAAQPHQHEQQAAHASSSHNRHGGHD